MKKPDIHLKMRVRGFYHFAKGKMDATGNIIPDTHKHILSCPNLITDQGMNYIFASVNIGSLSNNHLFPWCFVGTGNTTPAFTDTQLDAYLNDHDSSPTAATITYVNDADGHYWRYLSTYRFNAGTATGNIAEVGVGRRNDLLQSRALILDGGGSPTTITVLADEYLDVTYEWRNYIDVSDKTLVASISGVPYDVTYRPCSISTPPSIIYPLSQVPSSTGLGRVRETQTLGVVTSAPSGTASADLGLTYAAYVTDSWYADATMDWGLTAGNFATGIGSLEFQCSQAQYQFNFTPKIPKDSTKVLSLTVRVSWDRY